MARVTADAPSATACPVLPRLIGHRGLAAHAPENTLVGIRTAAAHGLDWVEFDAKLTADGIVILMHDATLDRTTDGSGPVAKRSFDAIRKLDAGRWFAPAFAGERVPTLVDALSLLSELGMGCNVEIKPCPGGEMETAQAVAATLQAHGTALRDRLIVSSFVPAAIARLRDVAPMLPRGLLVWDRTATMLDEAAALGCMSIHCAHQHLDADLACAVRSAGYRLVVYTVNDPVLAVRLIDWGCDTIISDTSGALGDRPGCGPGNRQGDNGLHVGSAAGRSRARDGMTDPRSANVRGGAGGIEGPKPAA